MLFINTFYIHFLNTELTLYLVVKFVKFRLNYKLYPLTLSKIHFSPLISLLFNLIFSFSILFNLVLSLVSVKI